MEHGDPGCRRQRVGAEETAEEDDRPVEQPAGRTPRERGCETGQRGRRKNEPEARRQAVLRREGGVDPGADRTGDDHEIAADLRHRTITVPVMSCEWSVQT